MRPIGIPRVGIKVAKQKPAQRMRIAHHADVMFCPKPNASCLSEWSICLSDSMQKHGGELRALNCPPKPPYIAQCSFDSHKRRKHIETSALILLFTHAPAAGTTW